jgi:DNA repair exonuclease SbcCD ATPase subunit
LIIFEKVRYKNLLSTGNAFTEIELNKTKNTLIVGKNGSGKTTMLDAITFALFGKPFRNVNKPSIINSTNKEELVVELEFKIGGHAYKIIRGMKPNIFEIYKDGLMLDQTTKMADYQANLENYILKLNYKTFTQVVILGAASFKPFMQLAPATRRSVIEDLLDIQIFSTMNVVAKQRMQVNKEDLEKNRAISVLTDEKVRVLRKTLEGLTAADDKRNEELQDKISEYKETIDILLDEQRRIPIIMKCIQDCDAMLRTNNIQLQKYRDLHSKIKANVEREEDEKTFFHDNETCPTCKQGMSHDLRADTQQKNEAKIKEYTDALAKLVEKISDILAATAPVESNRSNYQSELATLNSRTTEINHYVRLMAEAQKQLDKPDVAQDILQDTTDALQVGVDELEILEKEKAGLLVDRQYLDMIISLLKDGGIKTKIVKQYLPLINKYINQYLAVMNFYVGFNINENFEETITSRFRDEFTYDNFSEGEKKRIDLAILFAWRTIAKLKNSINTNLLIFDETLDSSLDGDGTDEFMGILNNLTSDSNTFIISHKRDAFMEKFDKVIKFEKIKDFSRIVD